MESLGSLKLSSLDSNALQNLEYVRRRGAAGDLGRLHTQKAFLQTLGQLELAKFLNPAGLNNLGRNLFERTFASGDPAIGQPNSEGFGRIEQGFLESSNVEVVEELIAMIQAQRAFEINSRVVQTGDDMLTTVNGMRR